VVVVVVRVSERVSDNVCMCVCERESAREGQVDVLPGPLPRVPTRCGQMLELLS